MTISCKVTFTNTNWDRYTVESPKTGVLLRVNQGWVDAETEVFAKIRQAVAAARYQNSMTHEAYVVLTIPELKHFKARAEQEVRDQR